MSVDVNYYSFSPSRADKQWPHFIEDVSVLRKKHSPWDQHLRESEKLEEKQSEIEDAFQPRINKITKEIFDFFDQKGYIIPWIEWGAEEGMNKFGKPTHATNEDKMDYLKAYGCVYPRGSDLKNKNVPYLMLRTDAPELEEAYDQIINERNKAIDQLRKQVTIAPMNDRSVELNQRQEALDHHSQISYLIYEKNFNNDELKNDLKRLDIYYGSVVNEFFEDPKLEYHCLEALVAIYHLKTEDTLPTREEWIRLFQNISEEKIQEVGELLANDLYWEKNEAEWAVEDYLRSVRPVVKDLKETPDAMFMRLYDCNSEVEPNSAEAILLERAKKRSTECKGKLPPVL